MPRNYKRVCEVCKKVHSSTVWNKKYCSNECRIYGFANGFVSYEFGIDSCKVCKKLFEKKSGSHQFCSKECKGKWKYITGSGNTEAQYKKISGDWFKYFQRLVCQKDRGSLTSEMLIELLEKQEGKCALTGVTLTCILEKGNRAWTNASIDRIIPGGPYILENVRLTSARINIMRSNMSDEELLYWCKLVVQKEGN